MYSFRPKNPKLPLRLYVFLVSFVLLAVPIVYFIASLYPDKDLAALVLVLLSIPDGFLLSVFVPRFLKIRDNEDEQPYTRSSLGEAQILIMTTTTLTILVLGFSLVFV